MVKKIECEWPEIGASVKATLLEKDEPELCNELWERIPTPVKMICRHPTSTGYEFGAAERPPKQPVKMGTQATPLGRKKWLLTRIKSGSIVYSISGGYGGLTLFYGPCTEPLPTRGSVVARVDEEDMDDLVKGGKYVWNAQYITHLPTIMIVKRSE
jgi:hypothetical protein